MDIQGNIKIRHHNYTYPIDISTQKEGDIIFSFKEFERVYIKLESDDDIYLKVESNKSEDFIVLQKNKEYLLNDFDYERDDKDNDIYIPERYIIKVCKDRLENNYYFQVNSNALGENIRDIRNIVSDFAKGLELDLSNTSKGKIPITSKDKIYLPVFDKLSKQSDIILLSINEIIKNPILDLKKESILTKKIKKPTKKTIRYDIKKNITDYNTRSSIQEKCIITTNNKENSILKLSIKTIINACKEVDIYFNTIIKSLDDQIDHHNDLKIQYEDIMNAFTNRIGDKHKVRIKNKLKDINKDLKRLNSQKGLFEEKKTKINALKNNLYYFINETWLKEVEDNYYIGISQTINKNYHYKKIIDFSNSLKVAYDDMLSLQGTYQYKKTQDLYEIYILILVFKILISNNFEYIQEYDYDPIIMFKNHEYNFTNQNKTIRLLYDYTLQGTDEADYDNIVNQNGSSYRPDIILMMYEDNVFKGSIIIEIKCRRRHNIYTETGDTSVMSQLKDYTNYWYLDEEGTVDKTAIKKVYAVYPDYEYYRQDLNANQICLLSLNPVYDYEADYTYQKFKEEIENFI